MMGCAVTQVNEPTVVVLLFYRFMNPPIYHQQVQKTE